LTWRPAAQSHTFHGRDVLAPAAGMLASGRKSVGDLAAQAALEPILLDLHVAQSQPRRAVVIHVDRFGNATTNVPAEHLRHPGPQAIRFGRRSLGPVRQTYADVPSKTPLALIGSSGLLEIAVRNGSAAHVLGLRVGAEITLEYPDPF
jgi:S-adenosylmethionine hydrolase